MRATRITNVAALLAAVVVATGCSLSVGGKTMPQAEVEKQTAVELGKKVGIPTDQVPPVKCPGDLKAKVGTQMTCVLGDPGGKSYNTLLTVTKVDDSTDKVFFDIKVADRPRS